MDTVIFGMQPAMWAGAAIIISLLIGLYTVAYVEAWHRVSSSLTLLSLCKMHSKALPACMDP